MSGTDRLVSIGRVGGWDGGQWEGRGRFSSSVVGLEARVRPGLGILSGGGRAAAWSFDARVM